MLKRKKNLPLDYSLCNQTVTVYRRASLAREVLEGVYFEYADHREENSGVVGRSRSFLLIIPGARAIEPGDMVLEGIGPALTRWEDLQLGSYGRSCQVAAVQQRYYKGRVCHLEVRG